MKKAKQFKREDIRMRINGEEYPNVVGLSHYRGYGDSKHTVHLCFAIAGELTSDVVESVESQKLTDIKNGTIEEIFINEEGLTAYRIHNGVTFESTSSRIGSNDDGSEGGVYETYTFSTKSRSALFHIPKSMSLEEGIAKAKYMDEKNREYQFIKAMREREGL